VHPTNLVSATPSSALTYVAPDLGGIKCDHHPSGHGGCHVGYSRLIAADKAATSTLVASLQTPKS
jgi:hypothetical protein